MNSSRLLCSVMLLLCFLVVTLVTGCDPDNLSSSSLPTIEIDTTAGQVVLTDTITITGKVTQGKNELKDLVVLDDNEQKIADVTYDENGSFSYEFTLGDDLFSTCNFRVRDVNFLSNRERITFVRGETEANRGYPAQGEVVEEATGILINEELVNNILQTGIDVINYGLPDVIDEILPLSVTVPLSNIPFVKDAVLTAHDFSIGYLSLGPILFRDNEQIVTTDLDLENVYFDGSVVIRALLFGSFTVPFRAKTNIQNVVIDEFKMKVLFNESTNNIELQIDADDLDERFFDQLDIDVEIVGLPFWLNNILDWVIDLVVELAGHLFRALFDVLTIPIIDVDDLAMSINLSDIGAVLPDAEIFGAIWFPTNYVYKTNPNCSNCGELYVQPGLTLAPVSSNPLNPDLDHFYSTPDSGLPGYDALAFSYDNHNLSVAVNDDTVNMALFAAVQSGMFAEYDVTTVFEAVVQSKLNILLPEVHVSMKTPPIADWSGPAITTEASEDGEAVNAGTYMVRNFIVDIRDSSTGESVVRASVDVDVAMRLAMSADGTYIEAYMDRENSYFNIGYLYLLTGDVTGLANLVEDITLYMMDIVIGSLIKINVPHADVYGHEITPHIYRAEVGDGNMLLWLGMQRE